MQKIRIKPPEFSPQKYIFNCCSVNQFILCHLVWKKAHISSYPLQTHGLQGIFRLFPVDKAVDNVENSLGEIRKKSHNFMFM